MEKISFNHCTLPAGKICAISSMQAALKAFTKMNKKGFVALERVATPSGEQQIVWTSRNLGRVIAVLPVFEGETTTPEMLYTPMTQVKDGELLRYGDYFYLSYKNARGEMGLRALTVFADEETVRTACEKLKLNVVTVEVVQMYDAATQRYLAGAWLIKTLGADKPYTLIYVDLRDRVTLGELDFSKVAMQTVTPGRRFSANGTWYELCQDEVDRFYLSKSSMQVYRRRANA